MITDVVQRWRSGRTSYRPAGEPINPRHYEVAPTLAGTNSAAVSANCFFEITRSA